MLNQPFHRYIWKPPRYAEDGTRLPPTNWRSYFRGSTWQWDKLTQEYYLHLFAAEQPDLNWENEETRNAIYDDAMSFWLKRGVDGFRIDCVNMYSKGLDYQDAPIHFPEAYEQPAWTIYANGPRMHEFLTEMNQKVLRNYDTVTVGELPHTPDVKQVLDYVGRPDQLNMVFQFDIVDLGQGVPDKYQFQQWKLSTLKGIVTKWQQFIEGTDGWTTVFCENVSNSDPCLTRESLTHIPQHDQGRSVSRYGSDIPEHRAVSAKMLAIMMCSLTGTLFIYQGQEIGMINVPKEWPIEEYQDIETLNYYKQVAESTNNDKTALDYVMKSAQILGRDNARTPMQWDDSKFAGFTTYEKGPWMRVNDVYPEINVAKQQKEPDSVLNFWKRLIEIRKQHRELFIYGSFEPFELENEQTFIFAKKAALEMALVVLNFTGEEQQVTLPFKGLEFRVGNYADAHKEDVNGAGVETRVLRPWEGRLYIMKD